MFSGSSGPQPKGMRTCGTGPATNKKQVVKEGVKNEPFIDHRNYSIDSLGAWPVCLQPGRVGPHSPGLGGDTYHYLAGEENPLNTK